MFGGSKWEEKIQKCFLEKVELEMDIEGYVIESGMLSLLEGGLLGVRGGQVCLFPQIIIRKAGKCGAFSGRTRGFVWLEQKEYVENRFNNAEMGTI